MSVRIYRSGLIVLGALCLMMTPLAIVGAVSPIVTAVAFIAVILWIVIQAGSHQSRETKSNRRSG
ncbi:hypothetical protein ABMA10_19355 [Plantibacter sp. RU18]